MRSSCRIAVVAVVVTVLHMGCTSIRSTKTEMVRQETPGHILKIFDWNVLMHSGADSIFAHLPLDADVLLLQEVHKDVACSLKHRFAEQKFWFYSCSEAPQAKEDDPNLYWYPAIAVSSRFNVIGTPDCSVHRDDINGFMSVRVSFENKELRLVSLHLAPIDPWTLEDMHARQVDELLRLLPEEDDTPTIIGGDFNESPSGRNVAVVLERGFVDGVAGSRDRSPRSSTVAWPTWSFPIFQTRLDLLLHDSSFDAESAMTLPRGPSDHRPLLVTLRLKDGPRRASGTACGVSRAMSRE